MNITYSIQQVSNMTGLSKQVIRKWEDRYDVIQPKRLENGYRVYSEEEIAVLKKVIELTEAGHSVKQAANLLKNNIEKLVEQKITNTEFMTFIAELEQAGYELNEQKLIHLLEHAHHLYGIEVLANDIIVPFLEKVGQLWCDQKWGEYQEAVSSQTVRDFLANIRRQYKVEDNAPLVLGSCLPNERHEIPMQLLLIQCMLRGYRTLMLGPAPAPAAIQSAVQLTKPSIVLLSGSTKAIWFDEGLTLKELDRFASTCPQTNFYLGGAGVQDVLKPLQLKTLKEVHHLELILD